jgi:phosphatidylinositol kinase/protein kinase (PI-3  family)
VCCWPLQPVVRIIFKVQDDLRQDQLVLNLLKEMDRLWKDDPTVGDLHVTPYAVVPTWEAGGVVQVRPRSLSFPLQCGCAESCLS